METGTLAVLETARLRLRPIALTDEEDLFNLFNDPEVYRWIGGPRPRDACVAAVQAAVQHWEEKGHGIWVLAERATGRFVGRCGLRWLDDIAETELLYTLNREFWRRGLATEASVAALDFAFGPVGLRRVVALALPENRASRRVMEKVGMRLEKTAAFRDSPAVWYAISREEYPGFAPLSPRRFPGLLHGGAAPSCSLPPAAGAGPPTAPE
jgi:RimJ/RimL family protein N-acetyltransferase